MATNDPTVNAALDAVAAKLGLTREEALKVVVAKGLDGVGSGAGAGAQAFTQGNNVVFNQGGFAPGTTAGKNLQAHELTHVIQQKTAALRRP